MVNHSSATSAIDVPAERLSEPVLAFGISDDPSWRRNKSRVRTFCSSWSTSTAATRCGADGNACIKTPISTAWPATVRGSARRMRRLRRALRQASLLTGMSPWGHGMLRYASMARKWPVEMPPLPARRRVLCNVDRQESLHADAQRSRLRQDVRLRWTPGERQSRRLRHLACQSAPGVDEHSTGLGWNSRVAKPWPHDAKLHPTYWTAQQSIDFLNAYRDERPFFLKMSFHRPHSP